MFKIRDALRWGIPALIVCACQIGDNVTELPNEVTGNLYLPDGAPAANAEISLYPAGYLPGSTGGAPLSTSTDKNGRFEFTQVTAGEYNLLSRAYFRAAAESLFLFSDSISVTRALTLHADTLKASGSVTGTLQLQAGGDPRTTLIWVLGTGILDTVDSQGHFTLALPEGNYSLRIVTTLDKYLPLNLSLAVVSGVHDTLSAPIVLPPYDKIPVVSPSLHYDTLQQIAAFTWRKADTALASGYDLNFRGAEIFLPMNDTTYVDSFMIQDSSYEFTIRVVDKNGNEGVNSILDFQAVGMYQIIDSANMGNFASIRYNGRSWIMADAPPSSGKTAVTLMDTSLNVIGTFNLDSISSIQGIDASNRIWANAGAKNVRVFEPQGSGSNTVYSSTFSRGLSLSGAAGVLAVKKTRIFIGMSSQIVAFDTTLQSEGEFPTSLMSPSFTGLNLNLFDNNDNGTLMIQSNGNLVSVYDTLGNLQSQDQLPEGNVKWMMPTPSKGFFVQTGGYYDLLDSALNRRAIFLGRGNPSVSQTSFIDANNRIYLMQPGSAIKVYAPRHPY